MRLTIPPAKPCIECGGDPIHHRAHYWMQTAGIAAAPLLAFISRATDGIASGSRGREQQGNISKLFHRIGLGELLAEPDDHTLLLDQVLWQEAKNRGIEMFEFRLLGLPTASFIARFPDGRQIAFESVPLPANAPRSVWWIDNKSVMKKRFGPLGIPVPRGSAAYTLPHARSIFNSLRHPVIVKPAEGSASRHTTLHISDEAALERAFKIAKQVSPIVVIEEELRGSVYRPTVVGGRLVATIRRDPPRVVGDGTHTVNELIAEANKHPARGGPYYSPIKLTPVGERELALQNMTQESVPEAGQVVNLHQKINWALGGTTTDVTDDVHPDNKALFEEIARVLNAPLVGIDFITNDISRSWKEMEGCGIIECNGRPFFDNHHLPFEGQPRNVAGAIWDFATQERNKTALGISNA